MTAVATKMINNKNEREEEPAGHALPGASTLGCRVLTAPLVEQ